MQGRKTITNTEDDLPKEWFGANEPLDGRSVERTSWREFKWCLAKLDQFLNWVARRLVPYERTRFVFLILSLLALPILVEFVLDSKLGDYSPSASNNNFLSIFPKLLFAFIFGLTFFAMASICLANISSRERFGLAIALSICVGLLLWRIPEHWMNFQIRPHFEKWLILLVIVEVAVFSSVLGLFLQRKNSALTKFVGNFWLQVAIIGLIGLFIRTWVSWEDVDTAHLSRNSLSMTLVLLTAIVLPTMFLHVAKSAKNLLVWLIVIFAMSFIALKFLLVELYLAYQTFLLDGGFAAGSIIALAGTFRRPDVRQTQKSRTWRREILTTFAFLAIIGLTVYMRQNFAIALLFDQNGNSQFDLARFVKQHEAVARISFDRHFDQATIEIIEQTKDRKLVLNPQFALKLNSLKLVNLNSEVDISAMSKWINSSGSSTRFLTICDSQFTVSQLSGFKVGRLNIVNSTVIPSTNASIDVSWSLLVENCTEGTLANLSKGSDRPLNLVEIVNTKLNEADWNAIQRYIHCIFRVSKSGPDYPGLFRNRAKLVKIKDKFHFTFERSLDMKWNYEVIAVIAGLTIESQVYSSFADFDFEEEDIGIPLFFWGSLDTEKIPKNLTIEQLKKLHLLYESEQGVNSLFVPDVNLVSRVDLEVFSNLSCISTLETWTPGYGRFGNAQKVSIDLGKRILEFGKPLTVKELYLADEPNYEFLRFFPDLETLCLNFNDPGGVRPATIQKLRDEILAMKKLKRVLVDGTIYPEILEAVEKNASVEECLVTEGQANTFGSEVLISSKKLKIVSIDDPIWAPQHFQDHRNRVLKEIEIKYRKKAQEAVVDETAEDNIR